MIHTSTWYKMHMRPVLRRYREKQYPKSCEKLSPLDTINKVQEMNNQERMVLGIRPACLGPHSTDRTPSQHRLLLH